MLASVQRPLPGVGQAIAIGAGRCLPSGVITSEKRMVKRPIDRPISPGVAVSTVGGVTAEAPSGASRRRGVRSANRLSRSHIVEAS